MNEHDKLSTANRLRFFAFTPEEVEALLQLALWVKPPDPAIESVVAKLETK